MKTLTVNVYTIDELTENFKNFAIYEHLDFLRNTEYTSDTPEDIENRESLSFIDAYNNIIDNDYLYFGDGKLIPSKEYINVK